MSYNYTKLFTKILNVTEDIPTATKFLEWVTEPILSKRESSYKPVVEPRVMFDSEDNAYYVTSKDGTNQLEYDIQSGICLRLSIEELYELYKFGGVRYLIEVNENDIITYCDEYSYVNLCKYLNDKVYSDDPIISKSRLVSKTNNVFFSIRTTEFDKDFIKTKPSII
jgi:hypothetical protein